MTDRCPTHHTPARKEYDFGTVLPQPHVTVYSGCKCATYAAELPGGFEERHCQSFAEAEGYARLALAIWNVALTAPVTPLQDAHP